MIDSNLLKRFLAPLSVTPGAVNTLFADAKTGFGVVGDTSTAAWTMGSMLGLSIAGSGLQKLADLWDKYSGTYLKDFP